MSIGRYTLPVFTGHEYGPWTRASLLDTREQGPSRSAGAIVNEILHGGWSLDGSSKIRISSKSVKRFRSCWGSKFSHPHWLSHWLIQQLVLPYTYKPWWRHNYFLLAARVSNMTRGCSRNVNAGSIEYRPGLMLACCNYTCLTFSYLSKYRTSSQQCFMTSSTWIPTDNATGTFILIDFKLPTLHGITEQTKQTDFRSITAYGHRN